MNPYFQLGKSGDIGQQAMKNILQAYSVWENDVGYCQSMNFVVGFLLLLSGGNEFETFWMFSAFGKKNTVSGPKFDGIDGFYQENFPLLLSYIYIFNKLFEDHLPDLQDHFETCQIPDLYWLQNWYSSLFLYSFPAGYVIRIWDNLMAFGFPFLHSFTLGLLKTIQKDLLLLDMEGIGAYFKKLN